MGKFKKGWKDGSEIWLVSQKKLFFACGDGSEIMREGEERRPHEEFGLTAWTERVSRNSEALKSEVWNLLRKTYAEKYVKQRTQKISVLFLCKRR